MQDDARSEAERRFGLPAGTFPFESRFCQIGDAELHYVDEGSGPVLFMLHGNPTWCFVYRHLISALGKDYRCIALDLAGFGLSEAPPGFTCYPQDHAELVAAFLDALGLEDATLIAHDWGGPIGLWAMGATEGRITRVCLGNTWAWPVNGDFHFEWFSRLMGGTIGQFLNNRYLTFVNFVMPASMEPAPWLKPNDTSGCSATAPIRPCAFPASSNSRGDEAILRKEGGRLIIEPVRHDNSLKPGSFDCYQQALVSTDEKAPSGGRGLSVERQVPGY